MLRLGIAVALLAAGGFGLRADPRPRPARASATRTTVIYTDSRAAYSLGNTLELIQAHLRRVSTVLHSVPVAAVSSNRLDPADYRVVFCPHPAPELPPAVLEAVGDTNVPVLWIGYGAERLRERAPFGGDFGLEQFSKLTPGTNVIYRGQPWAASVAPLVEVRFPAGSKARTLLTAPVGDGGAPAPVCWVSGHVTFFGAIPDAGLLGALFGEIVWDYFGVTNVPPARLLLRIDDYQCDSDHEEFRRKVDYLGSRAIPFVLSVAPVCAVGEWSGREDYLAGLRYAQARGGRIVLRGHTPDAAGYEFWDGAQDRPRRDLPSGAARGRAENGARQLLDHGLFPLAWLTPREAISRHAAEEIASVFSLGVGRLQLSDASERDALAPAVITADAAGRLIVPENLGFVRLDATHALADLQREFARLRALRGLVAGAVIHAYQPLPVFIELVEWMEGLRVPFVDLAELDAAVRLRGAVLLAGQAQQPVRLEAGTTLRWRAWSRAGRLVSEATETVSTAAERVLGRRGSGDYELFEFTEGKE
ncbi:MAG TPA: DUF2334 domain-containing protein [Methylomirabilota bacterium]|nr:DUF2334 domain-containing protein [Methylomirabilota bacterium]